MDPTFCYRRSDQKTLLVTKTEWKIHYTYTMVVGELDSYAA